MTNTQNPNPKRSTVKHNLFAPDPVDSLDIILASIKSLESTLLGMKQIRQYVGRGPATEMLDSLIQEGELRIAEIKGRLIN